MSSQEHEREETPPVEEAAAPPPAGAPSPEAEVAVALGEKPPEGEEPAAEASEEERGAAGASSRKSRAEGERRPRGFRRRKVCAFCVENVSFIDYKDAAKLRRYLSDRARIEPRRKTGTCAKHQRWLSVALKRARHLALLPYTPEHIRLSGAQPSRR